MLSDCLHSLAVETYFTFQELYRYRHDFSADIFKMYTFISFYQNPSHSIFDLEVILFIRQLSLYFYISLWWLKKFYFWATESISFLIGYRRSMVSGITSTPKGIFPLSYTHIPKPKDISHSSQPTHILSSKYMHCRLSYTSRL